MELWQSWNPAAGFFHFSTKDVSYRRSIAEAEQLLRARAASRPSPSPLKHPPNGERVALPHGRTAHDLEMALRSRRTWRRFSARPLTNAALGTLLRLTFAVQYWVDLGLAGRAMLRTSPSAGARHPLEAYVVVQRVTGLGPGIYQYDPAAHDLLRVRKRAQAFDVYLPGQPSFRHAAALVFITAVFERTEWKYPCARAYRTILLEAGHFAQTFCLVATSLKLAPFCTAALADSLIERDLGIDGVTESVIYACGVGTRPPGTAWAPWPDTANVPRLSAPSWAKRRRKR